MKRDPATSFLLYGVLALLAFGLVAAALSGPERTTTNPDYENGLAYYSRNDLKSALAAFRKALTAEPERGECRRYIGEILVRMKQPFEGLEHLLEYLKTNPTDAGALAWTARGYMLEQNPDVALLYYEQACSAAPKWAEILKETAQVLMSRGRAMEAAGKIQQAMRCAPDDPELQEMLQRAMTAGVSADGRETRAPLAPDLGPTIPDPLRQIEQSRRRLP